mmetsp:Transcript_16004/g.45275  ORF Transcript_16004/g.45275 Transcript_16004/m.45275 type:complete len:472 (+) Transcript_16004:643-2058(+)
MYAYRQVQKICIVAMVSKCSFQFELVLVVPEKVACFVDRREPLFLGFLLLLRESDPQRIEITRYLLCACLVRAELGVKVLQTLGGLVRGHHELVLNGPNLAQARLLHQTGNNMVEHELYLKTARPVGCGLSCVTQSGDCTIVVLANRLLHHAERRAHLEHTLLELLALIGRRRDLSRETLLKLKRLGREVLIRCGQLVKNACNFCPERRLQGLVARCLLLQHATLVVLVHDIIHDVIEARSRCLSRDENSGVIRLFGEGTGDLVLVRFECTALFSARSVQSGSQLVHPSSQLIALGLEVLRALRHSKACALLCIAGGGGMKLIVSHALAIDPRINVLSHSCDLALRLRERRLDPFEIHLVRGRALGNLGFARAHLVENLSAVELLSVLAFPDCCLHTVQLLVELLGQRPNSLGEGDLNDLASSLKFPLCCLKLAAQRESGVLDVLSRLRLVPHSASHFCPDHFFEIEQLSK